MTVEIAPSILAADLARLGEEVAAVEAGGADWIHVDVMDGHFVPNLSLGTAIVATLKRISRLPLDVHLMIDNPEKHIEAFIKAGAALVTVHAEVVRDPLPIIAEIRRLGAGAGLAINPATPIEALAGVAASLDRILVMSVNPGFAGQAFIPTSVEKVARIHERLSAHGHRVPIAVDGGVDLTNAKSLARAGATVLIAATAIFRSADAAAATRAMREAAETDK